MRIAEWGLLILLGSPVGIAAAQQQKVDDQASQQQDDSLAAAARRAREQKKLQSKPVKVWSNDDIPKTPGGVSVVGQAAPSENTSEAGNKVATGQAADSAGTTAPSSTGKNRTEDLAPAKDQIQTIQTDLDILERKYTLDRETYYGKPDYASDTTGAANLKDEQDQIDSKRQELADAQKKLQDLQAKPDSADSASTDTSAPSK